MMQEDTRRQSMRTCIELVGPGKAQAAVPLVAVGALVVPPPIVAFSSAGRSLRLPGSILPAEVSSLVQLMPYAVADTACHS